MAKGVSHKKEAKKPKKAKADKKNKKKGLVLGAGSSKFREFVKKASSIENIVNAWDMSPDTSAVVYLEGLFQQLAGSKTRRKPKIPKVKAQWSPDV